MNHHAPDAPALTSRELLFAEVATSVRQTAPLWRLAIVVAAFVVLLVAHASIRMAAQRTTNEIRTFQAQAKEAAASREQLVLELAVRKGDAHLQAAARAYGLVAPVHAELIGASEDETP